MPKKEFYVYCVFGMFDNILYINTGAGESHKGDLRGGSECPELNRYYFNNGEGSCLKHLKLSTHPSEEEAENFKNLCLLVMKPKFISVESGEGITTPEVVELAEETEVVVYGGDEGEEEEGETSRLGRRTHLSKQEKEEIVRLATSATMKRKKIADIYGVHVDTVYRTIRGFKNGSFNNVFH